MKILRTALIVAATSLMPLTASAVEQDVVVVYDASGSMWGQIDGITKIEIARDVMADLVNGWADGVNLGLVTYGHRRSGDCSDIETLITPGPLDRASFIKTVNAIRPKGKTPISAAVQHAADALSYRDNPATVILISDGVETCRADPCALSEQLAKQGVNFTTHVIGFDLEDAAHESLACIAENTGGVFVPAQNASELKEALAHVQSVMELQPVTSVQAEPEPEPVPEPALEAQQQDSVIDLAAPEGAVTGSSFSVTWSPSLDPEDMIMLVPAGAEKNSTNDYFRVRDANKGNLVAPADTGLYEVRYVQNKDKNTLASVPVEVFEAEMDIDAPEQVTTGSSFSVSWSSAIHPEDMIMIVPAGAEKNSTNDYFRVRDANKGNLVAPADTGLYEVRYVLNKGKRTLASTPVELVEAEVGIDAPEQVTTGSSFSVSWSSAIHPEDMIMIVPAGSEKNSSNDYFRVRDASKGNLVAPADTGLYEVRYVLNKGKRTLASVPVELVEAQVTVSGPEVVRAETPVRVNWSDSIHPEDMIMLTPAGAEKNSSDNYLRVRDNRQGDLKGPAEPGLYEVRYVLNKGKRTLASHYLEVVAADAPLDDGAGLNVPAKAAAGATVTVSWTKPASEGDQRIAVARADQPDFSWVAAHRVGDATSMELKMPDQAGSYEVRFLDIKARQVLGRALVAVE